jgi:hypothetical protein
MVFPSEQKTSRRAAFPKITSPDGIAQNKNEGEELMQDNARGRFLIGDQNGWAFLKAPDGNLKMACKTRRIRFRRFLEKF